MIADQAAQHRISTLHAAQVPRAVERMKPCLSQFGGVSDVMQPSRSLKQLSIITKDRCQEPGSRCHPLDVRPAPRQRNFKELASKFFRPESLIHALQAMRRPRDMHRRSVPSGDVWLRLTRSGA